MEMAVATMNELVNAYGAPTVYGVAGGVAVVMLQNVVLPIARGRSTSAPVKLVENPSLRYDAKEVSDPATKGWGYTGVRFERCKDDDMVVMLVGDKHYPDISGKRIPHFIEFVLEMTQITKAQFDAPLVAPMRDHFERSSSAVSSVAKRALVDALGSRHVILDDLDLRIVHSRGGYFSYHVPTNTRLVDGVVRPSTVEEMQELVRICAKHKLCLIPRGGGTNVRPNNKLAHLVQEAF